MGPVSTLFALARVVIVLYYSIMPIPTSFNTFTASRTWIILLIGFGTPTVFDMDFGSLQPFVLGIVEATHSIRDLQVDWAGGLSGW